MVACKGAQTWSGMIARRLQGGRDDNTGSREVDDGAASREIFGWKIWQPNAVSESLRGLGFANVMQQFIYRRITVAMGIGDGRWAVAIENHSSK
jgi:hypothetical protein